MKLTKICGYLLPALTLAGAMAAAPLAIAQTAKAPMGTMAPASTISSHSMVKTSASTLPKADRFTTQAAANAHCQNDTVVWSTLTKSKTYHATGSKYYGKTKHGAYVCKGDADTAGFRQAKN